MGVAIDQSGGCQVAVPVELDPFVSSNRLDWHGLMARLAAAHAARQILQAPGGPISGSFAPGVAGEVAAWRIAASGPSAASSPDVNRNTKADGKSIRTIHRDDAGADRSIVRGRL
jgi:hypothetical protein